MSRRSEEQGLASSRGRPHERSVQNGKPNGQEPSA